ncbi:L,D-transpeptidase [Mangrovitalea sediminis]|uniref:L,D-transpeptidase n=1 Tax=Mangrovitalea sediminis TaxID=1982043 RepID=UPI000BE59E64|nr:L,D-transpeptidase [Mangrovitalea sediminis]
MPPSASDLTVLIDISQQCLTVQQDGVPVRSYSVSTARNGPGEQMGSGCTPRGRHYIRACIGAGQPEGTVFVGRRPTGERYSAALAQRYPERDWILSRILWLCGREPGINRLGQVDSQRRFIYIHGTPDDQPMGVALSHGCVRMRNRDVVELFDLVRPGTSVVIRE